MPEARRIRDVIPAEEPRRLAQRKSNGMASGDLLAFFELQGEFADQGLEPRFSRGIGLRLADLMFGAQLPIGLPFSPSSTISAFCSGFHLRPSMAVLPAPDSHALLP